MCIRARAKENMSLMVMPSMGSTNDMLCDMAAQESEESPLQASVEGEYLGSALPKEDF